MTQLVKKDSSWRTLRRKAVVGASSFALVAGMGVALAPVASAAVGAPTLTITAPASISNDGSAASAVQLGVQTASSAAADNLAATTQFQLGVKVPEGVVCGDVKIATASGAGNPFAAANATGTAPNCTITTTAGALAASGSPYSWTVNVTIKGAFPASGFDPAKNYTGPVALTFAVASYDTGVSPISVSANSQLVGNAAAVFNTTAVPAVAYGSSFNVQLVKTAGFPAGTYTARGYAKTDAGAWITALETRNVLTNSTVTKSGNAHTYISLNNVSTFLAASAPGAQGTDESGFFFDTFTGSIVFGTLDTSWVGTGPGVLVNKFVPSPVNSGASKYTWTIINDNNVKVRDAATNAAIPVPALADDEAASVQFNLALPQFSDVTDTNVFADAIASMAGAGYIQGYANGTFGPTQKVTRGEFAAVAARILVDLPHGSSYAYTCATATPSNFTDVSNTSIFCDDINTLAKAGVVTGTSATTFSPNALVTRDQVAAFIYRLNAVGLNANVQDAPKVATQFTDVPASNFASGDIKWGADNGIINGRTATTFDPAGKVLRQEAAGLLYRFAGTYGL